MDGYCKLLRSCYTIVVTDQLRRLSQKGLIMPDRLPAEAPTTCNCLLETCCNKAAHNRDDYQTGSHYRASTAAPKCVYKISTNAAFYLFTVVCVCKILLLPGVELHCPDRIDDAYLLLCPWFWMRRCTGQMSNNTWLLFAGKPQLFWCNSQLFWCKQPLFVCKQSLFACKFKQDILAFETGYDWLEQKETIEPAILQQV